MKSAVWRDARVYLKYIRMHFLSGLEYKGWWMMALQVLLVCVADFLPSFLIFARMGDIGAWTWERILLIYALAVASFGLAESFCRGFDYFPWHMLRSGNFDRLLLRPRSLAVQVAGSFFHIHRLARAAIGIFAAVWALSRLGVPATAFSVGVIGLALLGGTLVYSGVFVLCSGIAFFTIKALDWIYILTNASYQVTRIPIDYMPGLFRRAFTFLMPMLVISYYPAAVVCGWGEPVAAGFLALPAGAAFLGLSLLVWKLGVRHYQSTGS
ncbi:MAG: ABC-2 family transporter protein [Clostridiales bacterium]|jgi:ABC-2 type transport system permease protein|nr:ABC-2 family transporter protein [Clostridiales bacterium]